MVNRKNIQKWVDALRSGEYEQGVDGLRVRREGNRYTYCCLGVACEVAGITPEPNNTSNGYLSQFDMYDGSIVVLPVSVVNWLGVDSSNPVFGGCDAVHWNDNQGKTFDEIADLLEAEYL